VASGYAPRGSNPDCCAVHTALFVVRRLILWACIALIFLVPEGQQAAVLTLKQVKSMAGLMSLSASGTTGLSVRVEGTRLVDAAGNTLKLHGANISGLENTAIQNWTTNPWGDADMGTEPTWSKLVSWHMNAVRLPLNETSWLGHTCINPNTGASQNPDPGDNYRATVEKSVTDAVAAGLYVILDLHWTAPGAYCATGQAQMANTDNSIAFWTSIASTFKGNPAVLFELFNEPFGQNVYPVASSDWNILLNGGTYSSFVHQNTDTGSLETTNGSWQAAGMQAMLNAVRATGATNVVLVGTMGWDGDLSQWLAHKPTDPAGQMAAAWHCYPWGSDNTKPSWTGIGDQYTFAAAITTQVPIVVTETGDSLGLEQAFLPWADGTASVSYIAWAWDPWGNQWDLITDAAGDPTAFGTYYETHLTCVANGGSNCP
jgi:endoglucanase